MNKFYSYLTLVAALTLCSSCNEEWKDEQYEQYVSFKAPISDKGYTQINVRYKEDGKVTYKLPVVVSGTTINSSDLAVHVGVDPDTLKVLNRERFGTRTDLYYRELDAKCYDFSETVNIPAGSCTSELNIDFSLNDLDLVDKWVLPLTIKDDPSYNYQSNLRKNYRKALLRVMPFNDYSGSYSTTAMKTYFLNADGGWNADEPMVTSNRTAFVVDENTVYFYAGLVDEDLVERARYKVYVTFNENKSLTLTAEDPAINFQLSGDANPVYSVVESMDATRPYLKHRYTTLRLIYTFDDITSAPVPIRYIVMGSLTLERNINTQIPDEDQAIEW